MLAFKRAFTQPRMVFAASQTRGFSANWDAKERGEEKSYFSKQDAMTLKKLVAKMEARDSVVNEAAQEHSATCDDLAQIFERHNMDKDNKDSLLWQELMDWKRTKYWAPIPQWHPLATHSVINTGQAQGEKGEDGRISAEVF